MGEIKATIELENYLDKCLFDDEKLDKSAVRSWKMKALVDTGAVMLMLPQDVVEKLGLRTIRTAVVTYADERQEERKVAGGLFIRIGDRETIANCIIGPPNSEALIGQIVMEELDLIPDPRRRTIGPRPESPIYASLKMK
ncbi:MAG: aspartyl protease family protein [Candidatus Kapabacteria bacterium]|nr:aspartyl protease family protein [Candidatus Kapabacteria bacterium]